MNVEVCDQRALLSPRPPRRQESVDYYYQENVDCRDAAKLLLHTSQSSDAAFSADYFLATTPRKPERQVSKEVSTHGDYHCHGAAAPSWRSSPPKQSPTSVLTLFNDLEPRPPLPVSPVSKLSPRAPVRQLSNHAKSSRALMAMMPPLLVSTGYGGALQLPTNVPSLSSSDVDTCVQQQQAAQPVGTFTRTPRHTRARGRYHPLSSEKATATTLTAQNWHFVQRHHSDGSDLTMSEFGIDEDSTHMPTLVAASSIVGGGSNGCRPVSLRDKPPTFPRRRRCSGTLGTN